MGGKRRALIIANDEYEDKGLGCLLAPAADAEALGKVLADPRIGNFDVHVVRNAPSYVIQERIEDILSESRSDDELLLHFSCHGLKSESGELFFAGRNTRPNRLGSTAVAADFVQRCMQSSRSRSIVLLLNCCFGGAFSQGVRVRASGDVNMRDSFPGGKLGSGRGRAVITASSAMEYAFEGDQLTDGRSSKPSVFTSALVEGLASGEADRNQDGWVSLNELYDYVFDRVRERNPHQTPSRDMETQGDFYVARRSRPVTTPAALTPELQDVIDSPLAGVRLGAVQELASVLQGRHAGRALAARMALERLAHDDSRRVQEAAAAMLTANPLVVGMAEEERLERERAVEQARVAAKRAEEQCLQQQRAAEQARAEKAREARRAKQARRESVAGSRSTVARWFWAVVTTLWTLAPLVSLGLLAPPVLLHIALSLRRRWMWLVFGLSFPMVIVGYMFAGADKYSGNSALRAAGFVLILTLAAATTTVAALLRRAVFSRRFAKDERSRHRHATD